MHEADAPGRAGQLRRQAQVGILEHDRLLGERALPTQSEVAPQAGAHGQHGDRAGQHEQGQRVAAEEARFGRWRGGAAHVAGGCPNL